MNAERIVALRRDRWARLGALLDRVQARGPAGLGPPEVREFGRLYREAAADLARLRTAGADPEIERYVERLVAGGHNALYRAGGEGAGGVGLGRFLLRGFPALVRRSGGAVATAAAVWVLGVLLAYAVAVVRPDLARDLCPQQYLDRAEAAVAERAAEGRAVYVRMDPAFTPLWSSTLVANNVQATFVVFAFGITAGVGTALLLLLNGVLFGAVAAVFAGEGVAGVFWTFVAAHGPVEIPAFLIAGAAGLRLGGALLRPGMRTRRDALVREAVDAGRLLGGTTVLLVVAALVEAFVSPSAMPPWGKAAVGLGAGGAVLAWILLGGRGEAEEEGEEEIPGMGSAAAAAAPR
ncbi:MAG: stage II sporulation protein M [Planctomycetes bacterium]|nr:stage II sporulation protein M [Planctomycetota bacterium]